MVESGGLYMDDVELLTFLERVTEALLHTLPDEQRYSVQSAEEAELAVAQIFTWSSMDSTSSITFPTEDGDWLQVARAALTELERDDVARSIVERQKETPERELQMGIILPDASVVVLALLITWLQTRVALQIRRRNGKVEFNFEIRKELLDSKSLSYFLEIIRNLLAPKK